MSNMILLKQEHFLCESKDVDILMYQINGKAFFNATKVWQNFGCPEVLAIDVYLRTDSPRKLMLQMYGNSNGFDKLLNEINMLSQNLVKQGFKFRGLASSKAPNDVESFLASTNTFRLKKFASHFEDGFVHSVKGKNASTFLCYDLFLDYCTHLSTQLKLQVFETFKRFGDLTKLEGQSLIDALQRKLDEEKSKLPTFTSQTVSRFVREEVKEKTKNLQQSIQDVFHSSAPPSKEGNMYAYIHDEINTKLFGANSSKMHKIIELQKSSRIKLRDCMTDKAIRLLEQVESAVYVFLSDCYANTITPSLEELDSVIEESCNAALSVARRIKDSFLILQNAIERDYDLLVKNADCVKDLGVVPRPDEICEKTKLIPITNATKQLVSEIPKRDNKCMSEQLTLF
jgi:hypothetical protein